jgi:hypothetical protein
MDARLVHHLLVMEAHVWLLANLSWIRLHHWVCTLWKNWKNRNAWCFKNTNANGLHLSLPTQS